MLTFVMIPKQNRLKNRSAFNATYKLKHTVHKGGITLFAGILKNCDSVTKAGFVVSKKTHKRAVKRNRLKRLMRESYRQLLKSESLGDSQKYVSLIFVGSGHALAKTYNEVYNIIRTLINQI